MNSNSDNTSKKGHYLGTEIDEKWWKRYSKNKFLARGNGEYWYDGDSFYFHRLLTKKPISIPLRNIEDYKLGTWHAGRWGAGQKILKIIWRNNNQKLSSGFLISKDLTEIEELIADLKKVS